MERRWPLGLGLLLLLCAPLPPGTRAKEGTDPRSRPYPLLWGSAGILVQEPAFRRRPSPRPPFQRSCFAPQPGDRLARPVFGL